MSDDKRCRRAVCGRTAHTDPKGALARTAGTQRMGDEAKALRLKHHAATYLTSRAPSGRIIAICSLRFLEAG